MEETQTNFICTGWLYISCAVNEHLVLIQCYYRRKHKLTNFIYTEEYHQVETVLAKDLQKDLKDLLKDPETITASLCVCVVLLTTAKSINSN